MIAILAMGEPLTQRPWIIAQVTGPILPPRRPPFGADASMACQMYPNTGGKTITTIAAHTA